MTEYVFAKPREGGRVRRPDQGMRPMREEGEMIPRIDFYNRLLLTGDLVECDRPPEEPAQAAADAPASASDAANASTAPAKPSRKPRR